MNLLDSLKRCTTVVADTGASDAIAEHRLQDTTTNPSLLLQPVVAAVLAAAILSEPLSAVQILGGAITLAGVALASRSSH